MHNTTLKIIYINPWSICNKFSDVKYFITQSNCDVVAVSETWLNEDISTSHYDIDNYHLFRRQQW
jgi:hypothetical protein